MSPPEKHSNRGGDRAQGEDDDVGQNEQAAAQLRRLHAAEKWERGEKNDHEQRGDDQLDVKEAAAKGVDGDVAAEEAAQAREGQSRGEEHDDGNADDALQAGPNLGEDVLSLWVFQ